MEFQRRTSLTTRSNVRMFSLMRWITAVIIRPISNRLLFKINRLIRRYCQGVSNYKLKGYHLVHVGQDLLHEVEEITVHLIIGVNHISVF